MDSISDEIHIGEKNMKIAFIVGGFPSISETFILNQITGLIDRGHDVEIFAKGIYFFQFVIIFKEN